VTWLPGSGDAVPGSSRSAADSGLRRPPATVRPTPDGLLATLRAALGRGDVLMAYDAAVPAMDAEPQSLESAFVAALALARAGASERARASGTELLARIDGTSEVPVRRPPGRRGSGGCTRR
jgi:hypothetical protein